MAVTEADIRAVADAAIRQFGDKYPNLRNGEITIKFRKRKSACSYWYRRLIVFPKQWMEDSEPWALHVIIRELAHIAAPLGVGHNHIFRAIEIDMHKPWGLVPSDYARAYCRKLYQDGELVWEKPRRARHKSVAECGLKHGDPVRYDGKKKDPTPWYGKIVKVNRVNVVVKVISPTHRMGRWRIRAAALTKISQKDFNKVFEDWIVSVIRHGKKP